MNLPLPIEGQPSNKKHFLVNLLEIFISILIIVMLVLGIGFFGGAGVSFFSGSAETLTLSVDAEALKLLHEIVMLLIGIGLISISFVLSYFLPRDGQK